MSTIASAASQQAAVTTQTESDVARETLTGNFQDFLTLFVTQLQHQDPLEPMETSEFTNSLANLSSVEQAVNMNSNMEKLLEMFSTTQVSDSASYIDKMVEFESKQFALQGGQAEFAYILEENSQATPIAVTDSNGRLVFQTVGSTAAGKHALQWDGKDMDGNQLPDGTYTVTVAAEDKAGEIKNVPTTGVAPVTGVSFENGETLLEVAGYGISIDDVISIRSTKF